MSEPNLRFPEFTGEWQEKKLGDISSDGRYGMNAAATDFDGENKYLRITDISEDSNNYVPKPLCSPNGNLEDKFLLKENDLLFARTGASTGKSYLYNTEDGKLYFAGFLIKFHVNKANSKFVFYNTLRSKYENWVRIMSVRSGQPGINAEEYKKLEINLPSIKEQEKIAFFLSKVDEKIGFLEKKLDLWETYKKGIIQKIFSQKLKFKDENGEDYPVWEEKKLSNVSECLDNIRKPLNSSYRLKMKGDIPYFGANGIVDYVNNYIFDEPLVLLAEDGGNFEEFQNKPIAQLITGKSWVNNHAHVLRNRSEITIEFLFYSLVHKDIRKYINGTSRSKLNKKDMLSIYLTVPALSEQKKNVNIFSVVDTKINKIIQEIKLCKKFKNGLLQKMFC